MVRWSSVQEELAALLGAYGSPGSRATPEYPFLALRRSGWWELEGVTEDPPPAHSSGALRWLSEHDPLGGLPQDRYDLLADDDEARGTVAGLLLLRFFPAVTAGALAVDLLRQVGMCQTRAAVVDGWDLAPGDVLRRPTLHERFGGQRQGVIATPSGGKRVLIFESSEGASYGHNYDGWQPDGSYHYTGQGTEGDQTFTAMNTAVLDSGRELHLFKESADTVLTYLGQFAADPVEPYRREDAPDINDDMRSVLVFHLRPVDEVTRAPATLPAVPAASAREIPVEAKNVDSFASNPSAGPTRAERREAALIGRYVTWLAARGQQTVRHLIPVPGQSSSNYTDVFNKHTRELIEVKGVAARNYVRMALGQVLDYARYVEHDHKAVLLPTRPADDLVTLLTSNDIACIYEPHEGTFDRVDP